MVVVDSCLFSVGDQRFVYGQEQHGFRQIAFAVGDQVTRTQPGMATSDTCRVVHVIHARAHNRGWLS